MEVTPDIEILNAYSDCNEFSNEDRDLYFRSKKNLSLDEWEILMKQALCSHFNYNAFETGAVASVFRNIKNIEKCEFQAAREGSVCLYIKGPSEVYDAILGLELYSEGWKGSSPDEVSLETNIKSPTSESRGGYLRLWWD